jgi:hypothetical protein
LKYALNVEKNGMKAKVVSSLLIMLMMNGLKEKKYNSALGVDSA